MPRSCRTVKNDLASIFDPSRRRALVWPLKGSGFQMKQHVGNLELDKGVYRYPH